MANDKTDSGLYYVSLASCETDGDKELKFSTEKARVIGHNGTFNTVAVYDYVAACFRARSALEKEIEAYVAKGYERRCWPKVVDDEHHDFRVIARVGKPGKPSICLQAVVRLLEPYFDPWMY